MRQIIRFGLLGAALFGAVLPAHSQWYAGATAGESRATLKSTQADELAELGFLDASTRSDEKGTMVRVYGGYRLHRNFAVEVGYANLGKFGLRTTVTPAGSLDTSIRSNGLDVSAVGLLPLGEKFTLFARAGAFASRTKASYSSGGSVRLVDDQQEQTRRSSHWVYGAGAMYDFLPNLAFRMEFAHYDKLGDEFTGGEFKARSVSAGIQWRF